MNTIHLLHGTAWQDIPGVPLADLEIRYEGGGSETFTIIYGVHVRDWWELKKDEIKDPDSKIVWRGKNPQASAANATLRLYRTTFTNPHAERKIASIDYIARGSKSGPFMVGLTIEKP